MEVKRVHGLLLGLLLILGISSSAMGQITAGITVRVSRPDSGRVVAIGDSVVVTVANTLSSTPDSVYVRIVQVASASDTTTGTKSAIDSTGAAQGPALTAKFSKKATNITASGGSPTFRAAFNIAAGNPEILTRLAVVATVYSGAASGVQYHSLNGTATVGANPALGTVGDRKTFGVDGQRPVIANVDTVYLDGNTRPSTSVPVADGSGATTNRGYIARVSPTTGQRTFRAGETMGINIVLQPSAISQVASGSLAGAVVLVDSAGIAGISDESKARAKVRFLASALLNSDTTRAGNDTTSALQISTVRVAQRFSGSSISRKTIVLAAGQFPDNANVTAQAFLIDAAGNLSGSSAGAATATGVTASLTYLVDCVAPVFSSVYPDTAGKRFTGLRAVTADTIDASGTSKVAARLGQRPLRWSLSEQVDSLQIKIGTKTWTKGASAGAAAANVQASGVDSFDVNTAASSDIVVTGTTPGTIAKDGTAVDVTLTAVDNAGNSATKSVTGAILDSTALGFTGQFPRMINKSNKDSINAATSSVVFTLSETADSVRITYRKVGSSSGTVTTARGQGGGNININLTSAAAQRIDVQTDSLKDQNFYTLQLFGRDLAYNWTVTGPDTLFYNVGFKNPNSDSILVAVNSGSNDTAVVNVSGTGILLDVSARDTVLKSTAVTYGPNGVLVDVWSADTTANLVGVHIKGTGATEQAAIVTENGRRIKRATLDNGGWVLGARQLTISDTLAQNLLYVTIRDTVSTKKIRGQSASLAFQAGAMTKYKLMADGAVSVTADTAVVNADKPFGVNVQPQDKYGNPSLKTVDAIYTSGSGSGLALGEIFLEFAGDAADLGVPAGPQRISSAGWYTFDFWAPNRNDKFRVSARTTNVAGSTASGTYASATGHIWIQTTGAGGVVVIPGDPTITKPDTLIVEDYRGANGEGDQGGYVMVTFKNTPQHAQLAQYRVWREILVSTTLDSTGRVRTLTTPQLQWVPWAVVDAVPVLQGAAPLTRAVVPTLDGVATRWAIAAEQGGKSSEAATSSAAVAGRAGKVVYSPESVRETLTLLGFQSVMTEEEMAKVIGPAYGQAILGDRKDLLLGRLDLDALRQVALRIPDAVRAQTAGIRTSGATLAGAAVRAIDNIPPAAVSNEAATTAERQVTLSWAASKDDGIVGFITYRGYSAPIPGVRTYDVLRGVSETSLVKIASLAAGSTSFQDVVSPDLGNSLVYRIVATDLDNATPGKLVSVVFQAAGRIKFFTATNLPVYLMYDSKDPLFNLTEDFDDFFAFADSFGKSKGQAGFNFQADVDDDGDVDFDDFFTFADAFGREAVPTKATKAIARQTAPAGVNRDAGINLSLASDRIVAGQQVKLVVDVSNAVALKGYGFTLTYDSQKFELVEATAGDQNLLTQGGSTPVFLKNTQPGRIQIANAISGDGAVAGSGTLAQLVFNVKGDFEDNARFEIADGVLIDGSRLLNPAVTLGALDIQTTPKEFALNQNFPNPFNPETTIKYALAASGNVELRIYNMVGQVVRTLVNERQVAGRYSIRWDGKDGRGVSVSSGIYFYSLSADKFHEVKKLMLLK